MVDEVRSDVGQFVLPGGYVKDNVCYDKVLIKSMTGVEEDILVSRNVPIVKRLNMVFYNCIVELKSDSGEVINKNNPDELANAIDELPLVDRLYLLICLRRVSLGDMYSMAVKCLEANCGKVSRQVIDLSQAEVRPPFDKIKREYEFNLPSGKLVKARILTGKTEEQMVQKRQADKDVMSTSILSRVISIDNKPVTLKMIKELSIKERNFLRNKFDEMEGRVETDVIVVCPFCQTESTVALDLGQVDFFFPSLQGRD